MTMTTPNYDFDFNQILVDSNTRSREVVRQVRFRDLPGEKAALQALKFLIRQGVIGRAEHQGTSYYYTFAYPDTQGRDVVDQYWPVDVTTKYRDLFAEAWDHWEFVLQHRPNVAYSNPKDNIDWKRFGTNAMGSGAAIPRPSYPPSVLRPSKGEKKRMTDFFFPKATLPKPMKGGGGFMGIEEDLDEDTLTALVSATPMYRGARSGDPGSVTGPSYFASSEVFAKTYGPTAAFRLDLGSVLIVGREDWQEHFASNMYISVQDIAHRVMEAGFDSVATVHSTPSGMLIVVLLIDAADAQPWRT
jgi:hypothetical protein